MFGYAFVNFVDEAQALRARDTFEGMPCISEQSIPNLPEHGLCGVTGTETCQATCRSMKQPNKSLLLYIVELT